MRHKAAPNGSAIIPRSHSSKNTEEVPRTVSEPNHVANTVAITIYNGSFLQASKKSFSFFTLRDA
jgi:hypothetical protein